MNELIKGLISRNIFNSRIGLVRSVLAFGAILTFLTNDIGLITYRELYKLNEIESAGRSFISGYSLFEFFESGWVKWIAIVILLWSITGYFHKISIFFQAWVHLSICNSFIVIEGGDQIASNLCLLLIPIVLMDNRKNHWFSAKENEDDARPQTNLIANMYFFLIKLQVSVIYLHAAVGKLGVEEWLNGTCTYFWMSSNVFGAPPIFEGLVNWLTLSTFSPIISWSVIILELALFACILATSKRVKEGFLFLGIVFHFLILVAFGLITFYFSMFGALVLYLDDENRIGSWFTRFVKRKLKFNFIAAENTAMDANYAPEH